MKYGIALESKYEFKACRAADYADQQPLRFPRIFIKKIVMIEDESFEHIKWILLRYPIAGLIIATTELLAWRGKGVYPHPAGDPSDPVNSAHAVSMIGWGVEKKIEYFDIWNSWGSEWGHKGRAKIPCHLIKSLCYVKGAYFVT
ncbi:hypothetical protein ACP275_06G065500 [Erythranthe tilingii]